MSREGVEKERRRSRDGAEEEQRRNKGGQEKDMEAKVQNHGLPP